MTANTNKTPTLLVANRGEIAVRIMRTARAEGYRTIAIYSDADRDALHVQLADSAIVIGGKTPAESYLDIEKVIQAAGQAGATAVHPGYGFLAENPQFARACEATGLQFIGPAADVIELMGNKRRAKEFVIDAGVPCVPGFQGGQSDETLISHAEAIGFPLMIKAAAGGGGRGMRLVERTGELPAALRSARSEALGAFGSDELILEKALVDARHIEIQVFGDRQGNVIHLGERDCSIQRRHQKIVEESPSPAVGPELRERLGVAAVAAARACGYVGAGTVEFLLDRNGDFYFLEMNTRLQVEHPVTEMVTGYDLVAWQLAVARGEPLPVTQAEVHQRGHAIEVRLYAENPENHFLPQTGRILHWQPVDLSGVRSDDALATGSEVTPYYDAMLGKLIAWGKDREEARRRLHRALGELQLIGPKNNLPFLRQLLEHPVFATGEATTAFMERHFTAAAGTTPASATVSVAAVLTHWIQLKPADLRSGRADWRSGDHSLPLHYRLQCEGMELECDLQRLSPGNSYRVTSGNSEHVIEVHQLDGQFAHLVVDGARQRWFYLPRENALFLLDGGRQWEFVNITQAPAKSSARAGSGEITAPMNGCLLAVHVRAEQQVCRGDALAVIEAMKMEHTLTADCDGVVTRLTARAGEQVSGGQLLLQIEPVPVEG